MIDISTEETVNRVENCKKIKMNYNNTFVIRMVLHIVRCLCLYAFFLLAIYIYY